MFSNAYFTRHVYCLKLNIKKILDLSNLVKNILQDVGLDIAQANTGEWDYALNIHFTKNHVNTIPSHLKELNLHFRCLLFIHMN